MISTKWESFVSRLKLAANQALQNNRTSGVCIVTAYVVITSQGEPIVWVVPDAKRVEPSRDAAAALRLLVGEGI